MDFDMLKAIIEDFPEVKYIKPQWFGESAMHPQFHEMLEYLKEKDKDIYFYTNGSMINPVRLAEIDPVQIHFSIEADNKELYEKMRRGLNWEKVYNNIMEFQRLKKHTRTVARMTVTKENRERIDEIKEFWAKRVDGVSVYNEHSAGRDVGGSYKEVRTCSKPDDFMVIAWNGDYIICCTDYNRSVVLGNVKDGARKVWDEGAKQREAIKNGEMLDICNHCGFTHSAYLKRA
jgi:radical SAM protein with 4Fe4S-binding SPASM domain